MLPTARILFFVAYRLLTLCFLVAASGSTSQNCVLHLSRELYKSTIFLQNKANFKNTPICISVCKTSGYGKFRLWDSRKNKAKQSQFKANFSLKLALFFPILALVNNVFFENEMSNPIFEDIYFGKRKRQIGGGINKLSLFKRILCVVLRYTVFFSSIGFEQLAQAAIDYSELSTANWGTVNRDIHYYYDENGSCVKRIEAVKDEADPDSNFIEKTVYEYNLQNRLSLVKTTTDGVNWDITMYKYNDDGIRIEKNDNGTITTYLVDSHNHTGFAQVLEEWDTTSTPTLTKTYIIGDDVIGQADDDITFCALKRFI